MPGQLGRALDLATYLVNAKKFVEKDGTRSRDNWRTRADEIIECLAAIAGFTLEAGGLSSDSRARLQQVVNADPESQGAAE